MRTSQIAVAAMLLLAACGSDAGRVAQPEDDFLDLVEAECRTAAKGIDKLELVVPESGQVDAAVDLLSSALDALRDLEPQQSQKKDFDNMVGGITDLVSEGKELSRAIGAADVDAQTASIASLDEAAADTDRSAQSLGALRCKFLLPATAFDSAVPVDSIPIDTIPIDTIPIDTIPIDTVPLDTTPVTTGDEIYPDDLKSIALAPEGYLWVEDYVQADASGLFAKSILGPQVVSYSAGQLEFIAGGATASIYIVRLNTEWTENAIAQYLFWEGVDEGTDVVTPGGLTVRQKVEAFPSNDCIVYYTGMYGIAICTFTGIDGLPILDAFLAINPI